MDKNVFSELLLILSSIILTEVKLGSQTRQSLARIAWKPSLDLFATAISSPCSISVPN